MKYFFVSLFFCLPTHFLIAQNPDSSQFYFKEGLFKNGLRLYAMASKDFEKAIFHNPNFIDAYIKNGLANLEMSRIYEASQNFEKAYLLQPENNEVIKELTQLYFNNRQYQKAIDLVQKCVGCENSDQIKGTGYYHLEDYGKAQEYLQKAIVKNNKDAQAHYTLGRTFLELENEKSAIAFYLNAIDVDSTKFQWKYELGLIYYNQNDYKNALKYFDAAAASGLNKNNDFLENYGFAKIYNGDVEAGISSLETVLNKKPNNTELLKNIADAMYATKSYDAAIVYFEKLLTLNPKDASSLFMAGMTFQKMGQKQKGEKICDKAIQMDPSLAKNRQKKEMPGL